MFNILVKLILLLPMVVDLALEVVVEAVVEEVEVTYSTRSVKSQITMLYNVSNIMTITGKEISLPRDLLPPTPNNISYNCYPTTSSPTGSPTPPQTYIAHPQSHTP